MPQAMTPAHHPGTGDGGTLAVRTRRSGAVLLTTGLLLGVAVVLAVLLGQPQASAFEPWTEEGPTGQESGGGAGATAAEPEPATVEEVEEAAPADLAQEAAAPEDGGTAAATAQETATQATVAEEATTAAQADAERLLEGGEVAEPGPLPASGDQAPEVTDADQAPGAAPGGTEGGGRAPGPLGADTVPRFDTLREPGADELPAHVTGGGDKHPADEDGEEEAEELTEPATVTLPQGQATAPPMGDMAADAAHALPEGGLGGWSATTVEVAYGGVLRVTAQPGWNNSISIMRVGDVYTVVDTGAAVRVGEGCGPDALARNWARCSADGVVSLEVFASDGDDRVANDTATTSVLYGGPGADLMTGGPGPGVDVMLGGPGDDDLRGGGGTDILMGEEGPGDKLDGGDGALDACDPGTDGGTTVNCE